MWWVWLYLAGVLVTAGWVCRVCWAGLNREDRQDCPVASRAITAAAGVTAGAVWPLTGAVALARPVLWPPVDEHDVPSTVAELEAELDNTDRSVGGDQ